MRRSIASIAFVICGLLAGLAPARAASQSVTLTALPDKTTVAPTGPIPITIRLDTQGERKSRVLFSETDTYGRELPYPLGLTARVRDASGRVLTATDTSPDGWWSWYRVWSPLLLHGGKDEQVVAIARGKGIIRTVDLMTILRGCEPIGSGLPVGRLTVQLSLNGIRSNEFWVDVAEIRQGKASEPGRTN